MMQSGATLRFWWVKFAQPGRPMPVLAADRSESDSPPLNLSTSQRMSAKKRRPRRPVRRVAWTRIINTYTYNKTRKENRNE